MAFAKTDLFYVVKSAFHPNFGTWSQTELLRGAILCAVAKEDEFFVTTDTGWLPNTCITQRGDRMLRSSTFRTFDCPNGPDFTSKVWGPYSRSMIDEGLWIFNGSVHSDGSHKVRLFLAGSLESLECDDTIRHAVVQQSNFQALIGKELLKRVDQKFVVAPTVDLSRIFAR